MVDRLLMLTIALGPLQWITIANVGLALKPLHIPFFALAAYGWVFLLKNRVPAHVVKFILPFIVAYSVYILFLVVSSAIFNGSFAQIAKYVIYSLSAYGLVFALTSLKREAILSSLFWGGAIGAILFVAVAFFTLQLRGINMFNVVAAALKTGDPRLLQFMIFKNLFNAPGAATTDGDTVKTALRHTSLGFIFISFIVSLASLKTQKWAYAAATFAALIILLSVSRSLIVALFLVMIPVAIAGFSKRPAYAVIGSLGALTAFLFLLLNSDLSGIASIADQRFGDLDDDPRVGMYEAAWGEIHSSLFWGHGAGYEFYHGEVRPHQVHNLFMGAWMQGGLICLLAALCFTFYLLRIYIATILREFWNTPEVVLSGLLILPLFRSQISGNGGSYTLPEWICIAVVLALAIQNGSKKMRRQLSPFL